MVYRENLSTLKSQRGGGDKVSTLFKRGKRPPTSDDNTDKSRTNLSVGEDEDIPSPPENFEEVAVGEGQTFVIRPDGLMQPAPYTFYANPETKTTSLVVKFDPPFGPGIWCIINAGAEFQPALSGDTT